MFNRHLIKRTLTAGLVLGAAAFPAAAQARYVTDPPLPPAAAQPTAAPLASQSASSTQSGFQWGDAGIGAAGATVLLSAGVLGAGMTRRRRTRRLVVG